MKKQNTSKALGFTLIELLIVVAIIAILAAIAVPNFLEAQTRAKTSRAKSDMRSLAVALESYMIDHHRPIVGFNEGVSYGLWSVSDDVKRGIGAYAPLTTPVAYITTIPYDPFTEKAGSTNKRKWKVYFYESFLLRKTSSGAIPSPTSTTGKIMGRGYAWLLRSWGPSRIGKSPWETSILANQTVDNIYDATNGTKSQGFLLMTNKGFYSGPGS